MKNWCFWTVLFEKTVESPLDCKEIQSVHPKGNQSWIFIGITDAEAETPIIWPLDVKNWFILKHPDAGKDWRWEKKWTTENEVIGWHHRLNGHEFESTLGAGDGQGGLAWYSPWGDKQLDRSEQLNWTELMFNFCMCVILKGEGNGTPLQYSCLENTMDGGAWLAAVHGVAKSQTLLSDFPFTFHFHALEKEMATHSSSCLENPRDRGSWWASVCGVAQSWTQLKWLSSSSSIYT